LRQHIRPNSDIPRFATFGGSISNHLRAVAAVTQLLELNMLAFLRESPKGYHLPMLDLLQTKGVSVKLLSAEDYKRRENPEFLKELSKALGSFCLIPEGGNTSAAVSYIAQHTAQALTCYDDVFTPVGLGTTLAGLVAGSHESTHIWGISAVKADPSLPERVTSHLKSVNMRHKDNWTISYDYHFGGYAKTKPELDAFKAEFEAQTGIALCTTYTAKSAYAMWEKVRTRELANKRILWFNTYNPRD
jgi:1-aminocyclopropane-1-carboxylate deaminase